MKKIISTDNAPAAIGPYAQAVRYGNMLFVSGQIAIDPGTGQIVEGDIEAQTKQVLENLQAIIKAAGMTLPKCVEMLVLSERHGRFREI